MIRVMDVHKAFGQRNRIVKAVDGLSFTVEKGETVCLLGPNGAGKTTTLRMIATIISPDQGDITVDGYSVKRQPKQVREKIAYMAQEPDLNPFLNVLDTVKYYVEMVSGTKFHRKDVMEILSRFNLENHWYKKPIQLSTGLKRRVQLACVFGVDRDVIFLDEPTTGLDVEARRQTLNYIREMAAEEKKTLLLTTHLLDEAEFLARRVIVISGGRKIVDDSILNLKNKFKRIVRVDLSGALSENTLRGFCERWRCISASENSIEVEVDSLGDLKDILLALEGYGISILDLTIEGAKFEDVYLRIIEREGVQK